MPIVTIIYALALIGLGVFSYILTEMVSITALIPAFFGVPLLICGILARDEAKLRHAMHGAAVLGLLGFLGTAKSLLYIPDILNNVELARPEAVKAQIVMAALSLVFVALCIKSFVDVRRARRRAQ